MTIILDGTTGITTPAINSSGDLELPGGTANGVLYLNGSKIATSGSALVFDGTNLGVGTSSPATILSLGSANEILFDISAGDFPSATYDTSVFICRTGGAGSAPFNQAGSLVYRTRVTSTAGRSSHIFYTGSPSTERLRINESGNVGIGTTSPDNKLELLVGDNGGINIEQSGASQTGYLNFRDSDGTLSGRFSFDHGTDAFRFTTNNSELVRLTSSGNFGIGTSSPSEKLQITNGRIRINSATVASGFASNTIRIAGAQDVADDATVTVGISNSSLVFVAENNVGTGILFFCGYASGTVVKIADPSGIGATADTDNFICATKSATSSDLNIKNRLGSTKSITISVFSVSD
jgi:hypothetical protein